MPHHSAYVFNVKLNRSDRKALGELADFLTQPDAETPVTMSEAVRRAVRALHTNMRRRAARAARLA